MKSERILPPQNLHIKVSGNAGAGLENADWWCKLLLTPPQRFAVQTPNHLAVPKYIPGHRGSRRRTLELCRTEVQTWVVDGVGQSQRFDFRGRLQDLMNEEGSSAAAEVSSRAWRSEGWGHLGKSRAGSEPPTTQAPCSHCEPCEGRGWVKGYTESREGH